jgi:indolepyruvate ferredoxin oxidoreductase
MLAALTTSIAPPRITLDDKFVADSGTVLMSGIQALVRLVLEQRRLDSARGLNTAAFVSGYQGSPLGGLDRELARASEHLAAHQVVFQPGVNEELAATAVGGTQLLGELEGRRHDGVVGFWYGKNPGFDRAADAIRHSNVSGIAPLGGAVALVGDDPSCKSSTIASSCEPMCRSLVTPVLAPATIRELLELGLHAVALSRASGLWTAVKVVADVADASATVSLDGLFEAIPAPAQRPFEPAVLLPPTSLRAEADQLGERLQRAREYARVAGLNRIVFEPRRPRRTVVAAGLAHEALVRALADLGLGDRELDAIGLRLAKVAMPWPLDPAFAADVARGVEDVLVLEDKLPFLEGQLKELLYGTGPTAMVTGCSRLAGEGPVPPSGTVLEDDVVRYLASWLPPEDQPESLRLRAQGKATKLELDVVPAKRIPYFCSGCPHNRSTKAPADAVVGAGIGCHIMVELDEEGRGNLVGTPQMGGEGAQFLGLAPFTAEHHFVQNIGDGTFHHSGSLAVRAAIAAGMKITYKLLYNDAVAMTGGQQPEGQMTVPALTRLLAAEGVKAIAILTPEPAGYRGVELDRIAAVHHRDRLAEIEEELAAVEGVSVLIYDDRCATEERRLRKRGKLPTPKQRVWINERVCEGCGDCGKKSTCLSVQPVETELGRKTRIDQSSCNLDFSCLDGDCPSFVLVEPGATERPTAPAAPVDLPDPPRVAEPADRLLRMPGIGGTGIVTVSQILQMAARIDGLEAAGVEQTGLAQKGGPVISDVRIGPTASVGSLRAGRRSADLLLGFDLLGAAEPGNLAVADPARTVAVVSTAKVPTAGMITNPDAAAVSEQRLRRRIDAVTRSEDNVYLDAKELSTRLFGDHLPANLLLIGAAYQAGHLPLSAAAIEQAIELNGAAVATNTEAFRWGRAAVAEPQLLEVPSAPEPVAATAPDRRLQAILDGAQLSEPLRQLLERRAADLLDYQSSRYAREYLEAVLAAAERIEAAVGEGGEQLTLAYASGLHKLMAYKDEYEVARLHLDSVERARLANEFGDGARVTIQLHPPVLRALGVKRKVGFGRWAMPMLRLLRHGRVLRGRPWDPFGHARVRRVERELIAEHRGAVEEALEVLQPDNAHLFAELVALPDLVRGYEEIKLANVERFRDRRGELLAELGGEADR